MISLYLFFSMPYVALCLPLLSSFFSILFMPFSVFGFFLEFTKRKRNIGFWRRCEVCSLVHGVTSHCAFFVFELFLTPLFSPGSVPFFDVPVSLSMLFISLTKNFHFLLKYIKITVHCCIIVTVVTWNSAFIPLCHSFLLHMVSMLFTCHTDLNIDRRIGRLIQKKKNRVWEWAGLYERQQLYYRQRRAASKIRCSSTCARSNLFR